MAMILILHMVLKDSCLLPLRLVCMQSVEIVLTVAWRRICLLHLLPLDCLAKAGLSEKDPLAQSGLLFARVDVLMLHGIDIANPVIVTSKRPQAEIVKTSRQQRYPKYDP